jgi:hypothetical protein
MPSTINLQYESTTLSTLPVRKTKKKRRERPKENAYSQVWQLIFCLFVCFNEQTTTPTKRVRKQLSS